MYLYMHLVYIINLASFAINSYLVKGSFGVEACDRLSGSNCVAWCQCQNTFTSGSQVEEQRQQKLKSKLWNVSLVISFWVFCFSKS